MIREELSFRFEDTPKPWALGKPPLLGFPHVHHSIMFSQVLRAYLDHSDIHFLAVELPKGLETFVKDSLKYYPLPIVLYDKEFMETSPTGKQVPRSFYLLAPGDPVTEALLLAEKREINVFFVDKYEPYQENTLRFMDPMLLPSVGLDAYVKGHEWFNRTVDEYSLLREDIMTANILKIIKDHGETVLWVGGLSHWYTIQSNVRDNEVTEDDDWLLEETGVNPDNWVARVLHPSSLPYVLYEIPYFVSLYVLRRDEFRHSDALYILLKEAIEPYQEKFDETVSTTDLKRMLQFMRNLALMDGRVFPSLFNVVEAAKAMVNDDYALEVYRLAVSYPFYPKDLDSLPLIEFDHDLDPEATLSLKLRQRKPQPVLFRGEKARSVWDLIRAPPEEDYPGEWEDYWNASDGAYSYPPEDVFLEQFMNHIRKKFQRILAEERASTDLFKTSMKDGIDWRMTTQHIHEGKIYVKEFPKNVGFVDTIVMQFVENDLPYEYSMLWYAEHEYESNLSFISTPPDELIVGPGIARAKFAGFVSVYPPVSRVYYIPREYSDFSFRLIRTAMQCSLSKVIGFVGPKAPSMQAREYARKQGFRVLYLPLSSFSRDSVKRLRIFHVLRSPYLREIAKKYIGY